MANIKLLNSKNNSKIDTRLHMSKYDATTTRLLSSISQVAGQTRFSYIKGGNAPSKFPRDAAGSFNAGITYINFQSGTISGAYKSFSPFQAMIPTAGNAVACAVHLNADDELRFSYGVIGTASQVQSSITNFVIGTSAGNLKVLEDASLLWIVLLKSANGTTLSAISDADIYDFRPFLSARRPSARKVLMKDSVRGAVNHILADVSTGATQVLVANNEYNYRVGEKVFLKSSATVSSVIEQGLIDLGLGVYTTRPVSDPSSAKILRKSSGSAWNLGADYALGDDLTTVPLSGNKVYGSADGITVLHDSLDLRSYKSYAKFRARDLTSVLTYVPPNREIAIDPQTGYLKFGTDYDFGDGRDGALNLAAGTYNINQAIGGKTFCRVRKVTNAVVAAGNTIQYSGADLNLSVGDVVMLYTAQVKSVSDLSLAGQYDVLKVSAASAGSITVDYNISSGYNGTSNSYDGATNNVFVLTIPQFTSVTFQNGAVLTCDPFSATAGCGIVAFLANGTVNFIGTGKIDVSGKGFRGGTSAGGKGEGYIAGLYNTISQSTVDSGGGGGAFGTVGTSSLLPTAQKNGDFQAQGGRGGGSGATGGGAGGGGGYGTVGGTGGYSGAAGAGGGGGAATSVNGLTPVGTSNDGGLGDSALGITGGANGGAFGLALGGGLNSNGTSGAANIAVASNGGLRGLEEGSPELSKLYFGGGGGAGGAGASGGQSGGSASLTPGSGGGGGNPGGEGGTAIQGSAVGGAGGGIVLLYADVIMNARINSQGANGGVGGKGGNGASGTNGFVDGVDGPTSAQGIGGDGAGGGGGGGGGGGAGAGGSIFMTSRTATVGSLNAQAGTEGAGGVGGTGGSAGVGVINSYASAGGGGAGGSGTNGQAGGLGAVGRIRLNYYTLSSQFYPAAGSGTGALTAVPVGYLGATPRMDNFTPVNATYNFIDPNSDFNFQSEKAEITAISTESYGTPAIPAKRLTFGKSLQKSYAVTNSARVQRLDSYVTSDVAIQGLSGRILFDSGLIAASAGTKISNLKHGINLSPAQYKAVVLIYLSQPTSLQDAPIYYNMQCKNGAAVYGVYLDVNDTTFSYSIGKDGIYFFPGVAIEEVLTGYIRILFIEN